MTTEPQPMESPRMFHMTEPKADLKDPAIAALLGRGWTLAATFAAEENGRPGLVLLFVPPRPGTADHAIGRVASSPWTAPTLVAAFAAFGFSFCLALWAVTHLAVTVRP